MASDYTDMKTYKSSTEAEADRKVPKDAQFWWKSDAEEGRGKMFYAHAQAVKLDSSKREAANVRHARLYENVEINSLTGVDYATATVRQAILGAGVMTLNVVAAAIDTLGAKVAKNNPRPSFQTSGASWKAQMKARRLDKWSRGYAYEVKVYEKAKPVFFDAMTFGTGFLYVYKNPDDNRLDVERVIPSEMFVDDADGKYATPRQMFRRKIVPREVLIDLFPEHEEMILASKPPADELLQHQSRAPMVEVFEGWHLPSSKKAKDGMHCIAIDTGEIFCEEWKIDKFPFIVRRFKPRVVGFWGKGIAESLVGIQVELNRLVQSISKQLRRKGRGRTFVEYGSKVNVQQLTNDVGDIVFYRGAPPIVDAQNAVAPEEFMQVDRLYQRAFQEVGISELSASAKKPSGLDAAVALREYSDIESERFALVHQAHEQFFQDFMETSILLITKQYGWKGYKVKVPGRRNNTDVDWADINLDADSYTMQMFPVSSLPQTPAARYQKIKEMVADQMISKATGQRLLEFPDIEAEENLGNAAIDDVDATISAILDEDRPVLRPPEPYQNLQLLVERATAAYLYARHFKDIEPERLALMRNLIDQTTQSIVSMSAPPPMPAGPGMPPGAAAPPPGPGTMPPITNTNTNINAAPTPTVAPLIA